MKCIAMLSIVQFTLLIIIFRLLLTLVEVEEEVFAENYDDQEDDSIYKSGSYFEDGSRGGVTKDGDKTNFMVCGVFLIRHGTIS